MTVVRFLSISGLILVAGIDFFAVRWVVKKTLEPISQISQAAKRISARTLSLKLDYQGNQDEVKDLADAFDMMLLRLEANFDQQSQFISNLAHELRTPLTSLRLNIEALNDDTEATLTDYQDLTKTEERALSRLERLVEDLLLLAKGEKEITHQPIILGVLFEEILDELGPLAEKHKITLKMDREIDCEIWGDSVLLQHAFSNLVENGILYNRPGGFVEILVRRGDNQVVIEIRDNGIGIANEVQTKIFERFYRLKEGLGNSTNGKGLGLAIAQHIIELHQGQIKVESNFGAGSIFRVFINSGSTVFSGKIRAN